MADFTRFISYLYDYRAGERNRNLGFVKVEVRQGMCRITVNLNNGQVLQQEMTLFGYKTEDGKVKLYRIGMMDKGSKERQWRFPAGDLGGTGQDPEQLSGMLLLSEDRNRFLLTVWKDENLTAETIRQGEIRELSKPGSLTPEKNLSEDQNRRIRESSGRRSIEYKNQENEEGENRAEENMRKGTLSERNKPEQKKAGEHKAEEHKAEEHHRGETLSAADLQSEGDRTARQQTEAPGVKNTAAPPEGWRELCHLFPAARPFEPSVWEVLCISLQDIGRLPPENWVWGNNHFVLHSFYRYHHLVLARERVENRVYLGVPGEFDTNETFMAAMFGLRRFERERKGKSEMGYWLTPISLNAL